MKLLTASGELRIACATPEAARALAEALRVDDAGRIETRVEGAEVVARAEAATIGALLAGLDDWLACAGVARGAANALDQADG